jgi:hypothetical protein
MVIVRTILVASRGFVNVQKMITDDIRAFLQQRIKVEKRDVGIVVGLVDEHGSSIVTCGIMDGGTRQDVTVVVGSASIEPQLIRQRSPVRRPGTPLCGFGSGAGGLPTRHYLTQNLPLRIPVSLVKSIPAAPCGPLRPESAGMIVV